MKITQVNAVYFSPAGSTQKVIRQIASAIAQELGVPVTDVDFTLLLTATIMSGIFRDITKGRYSHMKQQTFSDIEYSNRRRKTKRRSSLTIWMV